ncbi:hypothetical protein [Streptomyces sp. UH6]|uniref:hypothetical protein n=1 Tax=Streptomyces sp. UH6 TaxID=2748379 RepID=UPI0015D4F73D|nr:hypothetical protein [Streptomyces sp. UH6]NYV73662.1 hypothetical protein [Streptomyces sp. UH6]
MQIDPSQITRDDAQHVLYHFGHGGWRPGSGTTAIIHAFTAVDPNHFRRLALGFPGLAAAIWIAQNTEDGIDRLQQIADGTAA